MTTVKTMHTTSVLSAHLAARFTIAVTVISSWLVVIAGVAMFAGCSTGPELVEPKRIASPYSAQQTWAVVPFVNESGVSVVDGASIADAFVYEVETARGLRAIPVNRVIDTMRALEMTNVRTNADALTLLTALDVDGIVIGTIDAYDPYRPVILGAAVQLFSQPSRDSTRASDDPRAISRTTTGHAEGNVTAITIAQASGIFDASDHGVRARLRQYATGRSAPQSAFGNDIYDVSMDLYARFVSHELLSELLHAEHQRLASHNVNQPPR